MDIAGYNFEGPYGIDREVLNRAAVYVILDGNYRVVDVGQSGETGARLANHERRSCWDMHGGEWVAVMWMPSDRYTREARESFERKIRGAEDPLCGEK